MCFRWTDQYSTKKTQKKVVYWKITMCFLLTKCFLIFAVDPMQMNKRTVICCVRYEQILHNTQYFIYHDVSQVFALNLCRFGLHELPQNRSNMPDWLVTWQLPTTDDFYPHLAGWRVFISNPGRSPGTLSYNSTAVK